MLVEHIHVVENACSKDYLDSEVHNFIHSSTGWRAGSGILRSSSQINRALQGCNWR